MVMFLVVVLAFLNPVLLNRLVAQPAKGAHALSLFGETKYGPDFKHFDYVNPQAPKGGQIRLAAIGTFDNLNPFILKGVGAAGSLSIYNRLLTKALDEPFTEYGQLAESIECPPERTWVIFNLRPEARWHDGKPVIAADVVFTFNTLVEKGIPFYRSFYADVVQVEALDQYRVKFSFKDGTNRELPLIIGQMRILPKHYWQGRDFAATTLEPPLGSGPYRIAALEPGRYISYQRVEDYWGKDLAVHRGRHNFDQVHYDYYRDANVAVEALKGGEYDFRYVGDAAEWASSYRDLDAVTDGRLIKEMIPHQVIRGMEGFVFNTRRSKFADRRVRQALAFAFDFEWTNANLLHGLFTRSSSYWNNSELAAVGLPQGKELEVLAEFGDGVVAEVLAGPYQPPRTDGSGNVRANLRRAKKLLAEAGWEVVEQKLVHMSSGEAMEIEFLLNSATYERVLAPMVKNLARLGIGARIRIVDTAQYQNRLQEYDYDVVSAYWGQTQTPGNEQRNMWTSLAARTPGSRNYGGISDPVVDQLVERVIAATSRPEQVALTRALDRVLLWGHYLVPGWHSRTYRLVYWNKFGKPAQPPANGLGFPDTWWSEPNKGSGL